MTEKLSMKLQHLLAKLAPETPIFWLNKQNLEFVRPFQLTTQPGRAAIERMEGTYYPPTENVLMCQVEWEGDRWVAPIPLKVVKVPYSKEVRPSGDERFWTFDW